MSAQGTDEIASFVGGPKSLKKFPCHLHPFFVRTARWGGFCVLFRRTIPHLDFDKKRCAFLVSCMNRAFEDRFGDCET